MTQTSNHLSDEMLLNYATGATPEAFSLVVATHLSMCEACLTRMARFDDLGGAVLAAQEGVALSPGLLEGAVASIVEEAPSQSDAQPQAQSRTFPPPLYAYLGCDPEEVKWSSIGNGIKQEILNTSSDALARLIYFPAGMALPTHGHQGTEITVVLQGGYSHENGSFERGDIETVDAGVVHTPVAHAGRDCICLTASEAPLKFSSLAARIMQPFLRL